ncbi:uncharacterized protein LOC122857982 [Aphidius gifuensis]|uniref:uncharacterized protein LOC122857982 n=1 Tax=Aphidius gifuensis TaxID=684658 RepID=UPI001CDB4A38|nr:uncharacterized protein LOC122857982 [Aphidius gifuensis]
MSYMFQEHGAKHVFNIPEGLRELCSDISREVLRSQPDDIYIFIANYVDALLVTRENAKVAVSVVNDITIGSECIVNILQKCGLKMDLVAASISKLQQCFRKFLYGTNGQSSTGISDRESQLSIRKILESTGTSVDTANKAAIKIQSVFRGHCERLKIDKSKDEIGATNTIEIQVKSTKKQIFETATSIPSAYCFCYCEKNVKINLQEDEKDEKKLRENGFARVKEGIQAVTGLNMIYDEYNVTLEQANRAAVIIQSAFRKYRSTRQLASKIF